MTLWFWFCALKNANLDIYDGVTTGINTRCVEEDNNSYYMDYVVRMFCNCLIEVFFFLSVL